jgi:quinoprotein dehydrogenase-associated probable ABC transporter substrate-binding protein
MLDRKHIAGAFVMSAWLCAQAGAAAPDAATPGDAAGAPLKVCADPSNLPLSNDKGEGYENKIADAMAKDMGKKVQYTFFPQRMGFVRNTLRARDDTTQAFKCDLIIGVPKGYELTATTQPYMHSTYALLIKSNGQLSSLHEAEDLAKLPAEKIAKLRIGAFSNTPGSDYVLKNALIDKALLIQHQNGDPAESPARAIERALDGDLIDGGILWGPIAGMLVKQHSGWRALPFTPTPDIRFDYEISMGMRQGEKDWKTAVDTWIGGHKPQIVAILKSYQIPVVDDSGHVQM